MKNICICIPCRFNSSRLPGKLTYKFGKEYTIVKTYLQAKKSKYASEVYLLIDDKRIYDIMINYTNNIIYTDINCKNGTERISKNLNLIPEKYDIIVNIQADEPFIDENNIDYAIEKHIENNDNKNIFYTTLHQKIDDNSYLNSPSCICVQFNNKNEVMTYSRSILPGNKDNVGDVNKINYFGFTGIYVFNRNLLETYHELEDTYYQKIEDIEQMKILENNFIVKTYECPYFNEISLNDKDDYEFLLKKYFS